MAMIQVDWKPDAKKLRQFGWISLVGFGVIGLVVGWKIGSFKEGGSMTVPYVLWGLAVLFWLMGLVAPKTLKPVYLLLTLVALPIGLILSNLVLLLIFLLLFTPIALFFKLVGRDGLRLKPIPDAESYWVKHAPPGEPKSYYRQF